MKLPDPFKDKMQLLLGETEARDLFLALHEKAVTGLRVNTLKLTPQDFQLRSSFDLTPIPWTNAGFVIDKEERAGKHPFHEAGIYYLQEPSAMAVAEALAPKPGDWVIDLAAAPGGKSTHLAALMEDTGLLVANEVNRKRSSALLENLERWGSQHTVITSAEIAQLAKLWGPVFDRVLLDVPCSGEGMFRKSEDALTMWSSSTVQQCAQRQNELLAEAARLVRPEGYLAYSTCTFSPEEDEQIIDSFLQIHPDFKLEPITLNGLSPGQPEWSIRKLEALKQTSRLWPHKQIGEGHFIALLRRQDGFASKRKYHRFDEAETKSIKLWQAFSEGSALEHFSQDKQLVAFDKRLFAIPKALPSLAQISALRAGLFLGWLEKNRFEPSHALALALKPNQVTNLNHLTLALDDPRLEAYLHGEVIEAAGEPGWLIICAESFPIGWGKRSQSIVKNSLPKGLRWR